MDEFRKPYEYFEEKGVGGILLVLFFMLISIEPFLGILSLAVGYNAYPDSKIFLPAFITFTAIYILFSLLSGILLKKLHSLAIAVTKVFLVFRIIFLLPVLIISMRFQLGTIALESNYALEHNSIISSFYISLSYMVIFSVGWYIYIVKSKKVHELFPEKKFNG